MAPAVSTLQGVRLATPVPAAAPASTSSPASVQLGNLRRSSLAFSSRNRRMVVHVPPAASASANELCMSTYGTGAVQTLRHRSVASVTRGSGSARHTRLYAAEGPQTAAEPSAGTTGKKSGESTTIDIVRQVIADQLDVKIDEVDSSTKFGDLGADSLDTVEIMMGLEDRCGIAFEEDGAESITTVQDAADLIDAMKKKKKK